MEPRHYPDLGEPASLEDILARLLETIAWEELALAALINAEAEKIQAVVEVGVLGPIDADELVELNLAVARVLEAIVKKEEMLRKKLNTVLAFKERRLS